MASKKSKSSVTNPPPYASAAPEAFGFLEIDSNFGTDQGDRDVWARSLVAGRKKLKKSVPDAVQLETAITNIKLDDTIKGASVCEITLYDEDWVLTDGGFFDADRDGRVDAIDVNYPDGSDLWWRLTQVGVDAKRGGGIYTLTFMERSAVYMDHHYGPLKWSRAKHTRAEFIKMLADKVTAGGGITFHSKELHKVQPVASLTPEEVKQRAKQRAENPSKDRKDKNKGINPDAHLTVKGVAADKAQKQRGETLLDSCDRLNATRRVMEAILCAAIAESVMGKDRGSRGTTLQTTEISERDLPLQAHYWLLGGKSFQGGGGIAYAKAHPDASPGQIATVVEAGGKAASFYDAYRNEASKWVDAYGGGGSGGGEPAKPRGTYTPSTWAAGLLSWLHINQTSVNLQAIIGWETAEGGHWNNDAKYNPLNTTQNMPGSGDTGTQGNISVFKSWEQGLDATVKTFQHPGHGYGAILEALRKSDSIEDIANAIAHSDWNPGGYPALLTAMQGAPSNLKNVDGGKPGSAGGGGGSGDSKEYTQQYNFQVGTTQNPHESFWSAANRLADQVKWPLFFDGSHLYYDPEPSLMRQKPVAVIDRDDASVVSFKCNWDGRHIATEATLVLLCDPFEFKAGEVFQLTGFGPASTGSTVDLPGRWLIEESERQRFEFTTRFSLKQAEDPGPEPRSTTATRQDKESGKSDPDSGAPGEQIKGAQIGSPIPGQKWGPSTHDTGGLAGYPARDYFAPPGNPVVAPETGRVFKLSGRNPKLGGSRGGPMGYSIYIAAGPRKYFMTHLDKVSVKVGDKVKQGEQIAVVAKSGAGTWDNGSTHCHQGINGPVPPTESSSGARSGKNIPVTS